MPPEDTEPEKVTGVDEASRLSQTLDIAWVVGPRAVAMLELTAVPNTGIPGGSTHFNFSRTFTCWMIS